MNIDELAGRVEMLSEMGRIALQERDHEDTIAGLRNELLDARMELHAAQREVLADIAAEWDGVLNGPTRHDDWDISFPCIRKAAEFADYAMYDGKWMYPYLVKAQLRSPVSNLTDSCVLTVTVNRSQGRKPRN